jgi:hypothetical protein
MRIEHPEDLRSDMVFQAPYHGTDISGKRMEERLFLDIVDFQGEFVFPDHSAGSLTDGKEVRVYLCCRP